MKFVVLASEFANFTQTLITGINSKPVLEVLEYTKLSLKENVLTGFASDIEFSVRCSLEVQGEEDGEMLIPAQRLFDVVKAFDGKDEITFESNATDYKATITTSSSKGFTSISGLDADDYIAINEVFEYNVEELPDGFNRVTMPAREIKKLADSTHYVMSHDDLRINMCGLLLQFREAYLYGVATDSLRLIRYRLDAGENTFPNDIDMLLPSKAVEVLRRLDTDNVSFIYEKKDDKVTSLRIDYRNITVVSRLIKETFPKYENIIPKTTECQAKCPIDDLLKALRKVEGSITKDKSTTKCMFTFTENSLKLATRGTQANGEQEISAELHDSESFEVTFNLFLVKEMLQTIKDIGGDTATFFFISPDRAVLIKPKEDTENILMILMPVRA